MHIARLFSGKSTLEKTIQAVRRVYAQADAQIARFQKRSGISCKPGCGQCCENPRVYATVLELFPLALYLWNSGTASMWMERIANHEDDNRCIFYAPDDTSPGHGRCSVYKNRALICRMFGFSARRDKKDKLSLVTCTIIKQLYPRAIERIHNEFDHFDVPRIADLSRSIGGIDPYRGVEQLQINRAVYAALEKVGFLLELSAHNRIQRRQTIVRIINTIKFGSVRILKQIEMAVFGRFRIKRGF